MPPPKINLENLAETLKNDTKVKVAGIDADGVLRGKIMTKSKFLSAATKGFGMSSALFGWDMHDETYTSANSITSAYDGYGDFIAIPDLSSFRRTSWEDDMPMFLLDFHGNDGKRVPACPRGVLKSVLARLEEKGVQAHAGVELEFFNYVTPPTEGVSDSNPARPGHLATFLENNPPSKLRGLTDGMFGYSVTRPTMNKEYFHAIYDQSIAFNCPLEGWHTESGPGTFEAALQVSPADQMADKVSLFKHLTKSLGALHGITPNFMAKPSTHLPGNSGHIHLSLSSAPSDGTPSRNLFARDPPAHSAAAAAPHLSDLGRHFLAGLLAALPSIMPLLAPTVNSYKRLVPNFWAPTRVSHGLEDRRAAIRVVASDPANTRFEVRVSGADLHPHYALAALVGAGWRGVERGLELEEEGEGEALPSTLEEATRAFGARGSVAREVLGDGFVDFFAATREHEVRLSRQAVTDWEFRRYIEVV